LSLIGVCISVFELLPSCPSVVKSQTPKGLSTGLSCGQVTCPPMPRFECQLDLPEPDFVAELCFDCDAFWSA
jgi:hypothetical protein